MAITGRKREVVQAACDSIKSRFGIAVQRHRGADHMPSAAPPSRARTSCSPPAPPASRCSRTQQWQDSRTLELIADANASPPAGIEGVGSKRPRHWQSHGKILFGPLGFGALKLALHRACIARLFEQNDLLLDAEEIYAIAKTMVG